MQSPVLCSCDDVTILAATLLALNGDEICLQQQLNCDFVSSMTCTESQAMSATDLRIKRSGKHTVAGKTMAAQ